MPQSLKLDFPFTAEQVVLMGRTPYAGGMFESPEDWAAVERAMDVTDTLEFRARDFRALSGGERQRVVLASALAQEPKALLLDEPTTFLDLQHQLTIYELLRKLSLEGMLVIAVTHDLNLAASFFRPRGGDEEGPRGSRRRSVRGAHDREDPGDLRSGSRVAETRWRKELDRIWRLKLSARRAPFACWPSPQSSLPPSGCSHP